MIVSEIVSPDGVPKLNLMVTMVVTEIVRLDGLL